MQRVCLLLCATGALAWCADLAAVRSVYLMPMAHGMDQYLANRLTNERVFQVVTDPKLADAVFTERIGEVFQAQWENLVPPPEPPPETPPAAKESKEAKTSEPAAPALLTDTVNKLANPALNSTFGRGRGTFFLVDVKSQQVVWSAFEAPKGTDAANLDRTASTIVKSLKKDLTPEKK